MDKYFRLFILFCILTAPLVSRAESDDSSGSGQISGQYLQENTSQDQIKALMRIPKVQEFEKVCAKENPDNISTCIWNKVQADPATLELVQKSVNNTKDGEEITSLTGRDVMSLTKEGSAGLEKLQSYYSARLHTALYGDQKDNTVYKAVDHGVFYELYKTQLGKNVILAISSFCIEAKTFQDIGLKAEGNNILKSYVLLYADKARRASMRNTNVESLKTATASSSWGFCLTSLNNLCTRKKLSGEDNDYYENALLDEEAKEADLVYTQKRACEVTNYIKNMRKTIATVDDIKEKFSTLGKAKSVSFSKTVKMFDGKEKGKSFDDLTSTSSNELVGESGLQEGLKDDLASLEKCITKDPETGSYEVIGDTKACGRYLNTDHAKLEKLKQEYELRAKTLASKVKELQDSTKTDEKDLINFLKEEGYSSKEIKKKLEKDIEGLRKEIGHRYEMEKLALIESLKDKINESKSVTDGEISGKDRSNLQRIHEELSSKTDDYAKLIHYNNIVSGYLDITTDGEKEKSRNTASIERELKDSVFSKDNAEKVGLTGISEEYLGDVETAIKDSGIELGKSTSARTELGVSTINESILDYDAGSGDDDEDSQ